MELQGICYKMHAGLKQPIVTDQQTCKANVEYKFVLDRAEIDIPFDTKLDITNEEIVFEEEENNELEDPNNFKL